MRWFKSRYSKLKIEVDSIKGEIGKNEDKPFMYMLEAFYGTRRTILSRLDELEKENRLLREYLGVEIHNAESRTSIRKKSKNRR